MNASGQAPLLRPCNGCGATLQIPAFNTAELKVECGGCHTQQLVSRQASSGQQMKMAPAQAPPSMGPLLHPCSGCHATLQIPPFDTPELKVECGGCHTQQLVTKPAVGNRSSQASGIKAQQQQLQQQQQQLQHQQLLQQQQQQQHMNQQSMQHMQRSAPKQSKPLQPSTKRQRIHGGMGGGRGDDDDEDDLPDDGEDPDVTKAAMEAMRLLYPHGQSEDVEAYFNAYSRELRRARRAKALAPPTPQEQQAQKEAIAIVQRRLASLGVSNTQVNRCFQAALLRPGLIPEPIDGKVSVEDVLNTVLVEGKCRHCDALVSARVRDVMFQADIGDLEDATARVICADPLCLVRGYSPAAAAHSLQAPHYVTFLCQGQPCLTDGEGHNHCHACPGFGKCLGDWRQQHCERCQSHFIHSCGECRADREREREAEAQAQAAGPSITDAIA